MFEDYLEFLKHRIEYDLASFADPGGVSLERNGRRFDAVWEIRGKSREARFTASQDRGITVTINGQSEPYRVFLAGTQMADLRHMAQMIRQVRSRDMFVPTKARFTDTDTIPNFTGTDMSPRPATDLLSDLLGRRETEVTRIVMVTGEAGAGKTRVLQELVQRHAAGYLNGLTDKLLLYVNAQGRALARLNEALATELQDLKVNLTYHSVAALTRVGLLVPVIDGFDELLGTSGYDDAFNSLAIFLEQLDGEGQLIASARSVYYEEEFLSRAGHASTTGGQAWSHVPVKIDPWDDDDRKEFLDTLADRESLPEEERGTLHARVDGIFKGNEELASKPLFFAKAVDLLRRDSEFSGSSGDDLLGMLTHRFLEREQREKLLDRQQKPLLSGDRLEQLMGELAEEMWNQETRELDLRSVREVAEYILDDREVPESARQIVAERMPTLAFLAPGKKHAAPSEKLQSILFEHEVFFFHFLARALVNRYVRGTDMRIILSRSALPEFVAERLAIELRLQERLSSLDGLQEILDRLSEAGRTEWRRTTQVRENAGLIVMALLREFAAGKEAGSEIVGRKIGNVVFPGSNLRDVTLRGCALINVSVRRTNLETTKFLECNAQDVLLLEPMVKVGSTRLELNGLHVPGEVIGVRVLNDEGASTIYAPERIAHILGDCGAQVEMRHSESQRDVSAELLELLQRLMRAYERANPVCEGDQHLSKLFGNPHWSALRGLLVEHGIVKRESRPTSGRSKEFLRRQFSPDAIMSGADRTYHNEPRIARFWDALETTSLETTAFREQSAMR